MKNLFALFLTLLSFLSFSQSTLINVYVINQGGCPYSLTDTWNSQTGAGNMNFLSIDSLGFQNVHHYSIPDTTYPINLTVCLYVGATQPPFPNQTPTCITQMVYGPGAITIVADCSVLGIEEFKPTPIKNILKVTDLSGKECELKRNEFLIIHFEDGTCEKVFINQ